MKRKVLNVLSNYEEEASKVEAWARSKHHQCLSDINHKNISAFVEPLINTLEKNNNIAQVSPKIFYHNQKNRIWYAGSIVNLPIGYIRHKGIRKNDSPIYSHLSKTDYATGCCLCMRSNDFIEIGMFDDSFPMYCEDVDLSLRFKEIGKKIFYVPDSKVWHKVSYSLAVELTNNTKTADLPV